VKALLHQIKELNFFLKTFAIKRLALVAIVFLMLMQTTLQFFSVTLLIPFISSYQNGGSLKNQGKFLSFIDSLYSGFPEEKRFFYILISMGLIIAVGFLIMIANKRFVLNFSVYKVQFKVSCELFDKIMKARPKFFYSKRSGNLINLLTADINRCNNCMNYALSISIQGMYIVGFLLSGIVIMPLYTMAVIMLFIILGFLLKYVMRYVRKLGKMNLQAQEKSNNVIIESMQGFRNILLASAKEKITDKYKALQDNYFRTSRNSVWLSSLMPTFVELAALIGILAFLVWHRQKFFDGDPEFLPRIVFFLIILGGSVQRVAKIHSMYTSFTFNFAGIENILKLNRELNEDILRNSGTNNIKIENFKNSLKLENLSFSYLGDSNNLEELSFEILKNKKIAFVGSSGSGKSTLIDIISGFHDDYTGNFHIDGVEMKELNRAQWRNLLGYVSQETFLFNDTVKNNLKFGFDRDIPEEELRRACEHAQILETIDSFEDGFNTLLGERGVRLSGGEKQRLAIARLFLKKPQIVLLDEATSSLDSESEQKVKNAIDSLSEGKTVISVAHRLSTIADFDHIFVLEAGRIVESGTHHELIDLKGRYFRFYNIQAMGGDFEL
jgi:ABC-type multidrug transport system fused ATPase/permease subunit